MTRVGILALQGDVGEHRSVLDSLGADVVEVRRAGDLDGVDSLVLPGGESTTIGLLMASSGLDEAIAKALAGGIPVLGTCAGMILLASEVVDGRHDQKSFSAIDMAVRRNGYGRQVASFETDLAVAGLEGGPVRAVFIRAPVVERVGPGVEVLARTSDGIPVVCREANATACSFHPELAGDARIHAMALDL